MEISIDLIKQFRQMTMASVKDCKECLIEAKGDLEVATELLKKKWLANAAKKADREMSEWIVKFENRNNRLIWLSIGCETDFVSRNDIFLELVEKLLVKLSNVSVDVNKIEDLPKEIAEELTNMVNELVGKLWENMKLSTIISRSTLDNEVYIYNHTNNKLTSVVTYKALSDNATESAKKIAMQTAAMNPEYTKIEDISKDYLDKIKKEFESEVVNTWKPANIIENIISGKLNKHLSDIVLTEQVYIWDDTKKIKDIINWNIELISCERFVI